MRNFNPEQYEALLERSKHQELQQHMMLERMVVEAAPNFRHRAIFDLGSGYGRCLPFLSAAKQLYQIEINPVMLSELRRRSAGVPNAEVVECDFGDIQNWVSLKESAQPMFVAMQNTLGTLEGNGESLFQGLRSISAGKHAYGVFSFFRQSAMPTWGRRFYASIAPMVGEIDETASDLSNGLFVSKTRYLSRWRSDAEIEALVAQLDGVMDVWVSTHHCVVVGFRLGVEATEVPTAHLVRAA